MGWEGRGWDVMPRDGLNLQLCRIQLVIGPRSVQWGSLFVSSRWMMQEQLHMLPWIEMAGCNATGPVCDDCDVMGAS